MKLTAIAFCLLLALPSLAGAACPKAQLLTGSQGFGQGMEIDAASGNWSGSPVIPGAQCIACFSWADGYFRTSGYTGTDWATAVDATEQFELVGPVTATPLSFSARLHVTGTVDTHGNGSASLGEGANVNEFVLPDGQSVTDVPVVLALQHFAGDQFNLNVLLRAGSTAYPYVAADVQGLFEFVGVPSGWSIRSCRGVDVPVPVKPTTWGGLRALYR